MTRDIHYFAISLEGETIELSQENYAKVKHIKFNN